MEIRKMNVWFAVWVLNCVYIAKSETIEKPSDCERTETWFIRGKSYIYSYTAATESNFVGVSPSKSSLKYICQVQIDVPRKCEALLKVSDCTVYERSPGPDDLYNELSSESVQFNEEISRHPVYFKYNKGEIQEDSIVLYEDDPMYIVNIKKAIISALQLKIQEMDTYAHPVQHVDIFGTCPTTYIFPEDNPNHIYTKRDITSCVVPQIYKLQTQILSFIKTVYGGYKEDHVSEPFYPFGSTVDCQFRLNSEKQIETVYCFQQQVFRPTAYNGTIYATAMANVSQLLELTAVTKLNSRRLDRRLNGRRTANILFEYEDSASTDVTQSQIIERLQGMVESVTSSNLQLLPEQFHQLVRLQREATSDILRSSMMAVWNCHGNTGEQCNRKHQMLEKDYYLDGLLSCGTSDCILEFTHCLKQGHVSWFTDRYFMYDMAFNHDVSLHVMNGILDLCNSRDRISCWLPLSIMINKLSETNIDMSQEDGPVYLTLLQLRQLIGDNCKTGIIQSLPKPRQVEEIDKLVLFLKTLGNIGRPVQSVFDSVNIESKKLVSAILQCAKNTELPKKVAKSAIQALTKLEVDSQIQEDLFTIIRDISREPVIRTSAFAKLFMMPDAAVVGQLLGLIHNEQMNNMRTYMVSSVNSMLENDQPDLQQLRILWRRAIHADRRKLPDISDDLFGKSRYIELSRYFKLPISVNMTGFQVEFDIVYDPASPGLNSAVVRVNRFSGEKQNIFEVGIDIEGLDMIMDAVVGQKGKGIYSLLKLFASARQMAQQQQQQQGQQPVFRGFDSYVIQQIMSLFEKVNYPKFQIPEGMVHWKLFGNEVLYLEIKDIVKLLMGRESGHQQHGPTTVERLLQRLQQGLAIGKTRSAKLIDLNKVLPTVSGLPLNMTVLVTASSSLDVNVNADLRSFMRQAGPLTSSGSVSASATGEFYGQLDVRLSTYYKAGIAMRLSGLVNAGLSASADFHMRRPTPRIIKNFRIEFDIDNVDNQFSAVKIRSKMYHVHNDVILEILGDPDYETEIQKCHIKLPYLLFGDQLCGNIVYPNVTTSKQHAYFPLSGPFSVDVVLQRADPNLERFDLDVTYQQLNSTEGYISDKVDMTITGQGQKLQRTITALILYDRQQRDITVDAEMPEAQANYHLRYKHVYGKTLESGTRLYEFIFDEYLERHSRYLYRSMLQYKRLLTAEQATNSLTGQLESGNRTEQELSLMVAIPVASLHLEFYNMKENLASHFVTEFNMTYFCSRTVPLLYMFHLNPKHAAQNGDATRIEFSNDAQFGYTEGSTAPFWNTNDNMYLKYPGQVIQLTNSMIANQTYAVRRTEITYLNSQQQQKTLMMKAHVENHTDATDLNYDYFMVMKNEDAFDITLQGHVHGHVKNFNLYTDIYFTKVTQDDERRKRSIKDIYDKFEEIENRVQSRNNEDSEIGEGTSETEVDTQTDNSDGNTDTGPVTTPQSPIQCRSIFEWDSWNLTLNFTWRAEPVFTPGSPNREPFGAEFVWNIDLLYPSCNMYKQVVSNGAFGKHINNTFADFRYWMDYLNLHKTHVVQQDGSLQETSSITKTLDVDIQYKYHQHFNFTLNYRGQRLNSSLEIYYQRQSPRYAEITVHFHADSVWMLLNFDHTELYIIRSDWPYGLSNFEHYMNTNHTLFVLQLNTTFDKSRGVVTYHQDGILTQKLPEGPLRTVITTDAGVSRTALPHYSLSFAQPDMVYIVDTALTHHDILNITYSFQQPGNIQIHALTALIETRSSTSIQVTLSWNPALTSSVKQKFKERLARVSQVFIDARNTMLMNTRRDIPDIVIPFINKTLGSVVNRVMYPLSVYLPIQRSHVGQMQEDTTTADKSMLHTGTGMNQGRKLLSMLMKVSADVLEMFGKSIVKPPAVISPYINNVIKPRLREILGDSSITFTLPLLYKWGNFMRFPSFPENQRYIHKLIFGTLARLSGRARQTRSDGGTDIALVYGRGQYVSTFDGNVYRIPFSSGVDHNYNGECTYMLMADFKDKKFAIILSNTEISLLTPTVTLTIDFYGRTFINLCNTAINLPFTSADSTISVSRNTFGIVVDTKYGVTISCDTSYDLSYFGKFDVCSISLESKHHNHTVGLLGTNDGEKGNDFRMPNSAVFSDIPQFLKGYALNGPEYCFHIDVENNPLVCVDKTKWHGHCDGLFRSRHSQLVACFDRADPSPFLNACKQDVELCRFNICQHVRAYLTLCAHRGLSLSPPSNPVNCIRVDDGRERFVNERTPVDILFVVSNDVIIEQGSEKVMSDVKTFVSALSHAATLDIQIGIIGNSGQHLPTEGSKRHFINLEFSAGSLQRTWIEVEDSSLKALLDMAASHPFRYNSRRLVVLLTKQQMITGDEKRLLIELYNKRKLRLHVISMFAELKGKRVLGINYNRKVIFTTKRKKTSKLPKGALMKVVEQTKGSVLDITPIIEGRRARMSHIANHLIEDVEYFSCHDGA